MSRANALTWMGVVLCLASCTAISKKTPLCYVKPAHQFHSAQSQQAAQVFWTAFQTADYASSDQALSLLTAASAADPTDTHLIELTGLCSFWKVVEHNRAGIPSQQLHGLAQQSLAYVEEAGRRDPGNRLTPGFISSARFQLGAMERNVPMMTEANCELQRNTEVYPQFHGFVEGWVLTAMLPPSHPAYDDAVEAYFATLDSCAGIRVPRSFPKIGPIGLSILAKRSEKETVCYNTNIAPHNVEGTMLGLGDALVKQGKFRQAKMAYESIPKIPAYVNWPFKDALTYRIQHMESLQRKWVADSGCVDAVEPAMLFQSTMACTCCHATCNPAGRYVCP